jgi:hypothetical protein
MSDSDSNRSVVGMFGDDLVDQRDTIEFTELLICVLELLFQFTHYLSFELWHTQKNLKDIMSVSLKQQI